MEAIDTRTAFLRTKHKIKKEQTMQVRSQLMRYAAMLTIPLLVTSLLFGYLYFSDSSADEMQYAEVNTASGAIIRYELPDKSIVWLNSGSKLRYPIKFKGDKRQVELEGEGYFEVKADKEHPFYVNTSTGLNVYVYGTHFNVSAYSDDDYVEAVLAEGRVNVIVPGNQSEIKLDPGQGLLYNESTQQTSKSEIDIYEKTAWKDGKLIFRNTSLEDVLKKLSRHFNVDIQLHNLSGKKYKYRATFTRENLNQILDYLSKSASLKWKSEEPVQQKDETFTQKKIIVTLY
ncbi:FecR family protein [Bacteroides ihuae]|uniref:FecR family protein n=1 Tax=Bacteroides ihuae TaxID=1852362 RepID=UPI001F1DB4BF|nr:FecR family protein [Bacteroides ihuae]